MSSRSSSGSRSPRRRGAGRARAALLASAVLALCACSTGTEALDDRGPVEPGGPLLALFPVENLTGRLAPLAELRALLADRLHAHGLRLLDDAALERALTRHRVRYMGGVERAFAGALRRETGAEGVLVPSLEVYDEGGPPRVALFLRLVSTGEAPSLRWIDSAGGAGDDAPGLLEMGMVEDVRVLAVRAVTSVVRSLVRHLAAPGTRVADPAVARKFQPKIAYRSDGLDPARAYSIAVLPFFNRSARGYAGEIVALHMIRNLAACQAGQGEPTCARLEIVEPGLVREELLRFRVIMADGISLADTETVLGALSADLVLNGEVLEYQDARGASLPPAVDFSVLFIERRSRRIVYSSYSHNTGDDGVYFFDVGRVRTAHAMAGRMARGIGERLLLGPSTPAAPGGAATQEIRRR